MGHEGMCRKLKLLVAAAVLLLGAGESVAEVTVGPPIEVPGLRRSSDFRAVGLAVLEDGSFAVGWRELVQLNRREGVSRYKLQFFHPDGSATSEPVIVFARKNGDVFGSVGSRGDRYFVTWQRFGRDTMAAFYDRDGERLGRPFPWPHSEVLFYGMHYRYGRGPSWRILPIVYHQAGLDQSLSPFYQPTLQVFSSKATSLGPPVMLATPQRRIYLEDVAVNGEGRIVVVSFQCLRGFRPGSRPTGSCERGAQIFDGSGRPRSPFLKEGIRQSAFTGIYSVAMDRRGRFLLAWGENVFTGPGRGDIVGRLYGRDGKPVSPYLSISGRDGSEAGPQVRVTDAGTFVIAWINYVPDTNLGSIALREFEPRRQAFGEPLLIAEEDPAVTDGYRFELNSSGRGVILWGEKVSLVTAEADQVEGLEDEESEDHD
jgi:hypothetical protein